MSDDPYKEPDQPWEGKTFGAAAAADEELVDDIAEGESGSVAPDDEAAAQELFEERSAEDDINQTAHRGAEEPDSRSDPASGAAGSTAERE